MPINEEDPLDQEETFIDYLLGSWCFTLPRQSPTLLQAAVESGLSLTVLGAIHLPAPFTLSYSDSLFIHKL